MDQQAQRHALAPGDGCVPLYCGDPTAELQAAHEGAVLADLSSRGKVRLGGRDAVSFLHNMCTQDIRAMRDYEAREAFLTTSQGRIVARTQVFKYPDALWLDLDPGLGAKVAAHLERFHVTEEVTICDESAAYALLVVAGPQAQHVLQRWHPELVHSLASRDCCLSSLPGLADTVLQARRMRDWVVPAIQLVVPVEYGAALQQALIHVGVCPIGWATVETLRIAAGTPRSGTDMDDSNFPQEMQRDNQALSFTKGCYLGQETIARIRTYGHVNRYLVGLRAEPTAWLDSYRAAQELVGATLMSQGTEVGRVTSAAYCYLRSRAIGLGSVRRGYHEPGRELVAACQRGTVALVVCTWPLPS